MLIERIRRGHLQRQTRGKCTDALHTFTHGDREHTSRTRRSSPGRPKRSRRTPAGRRRGTAEAFTDWVLLDPPAPPRGICLYCMMPFMEVRRLCSGSSEELRALARRPSRAPANPRDAARARVVSTALLRDPKDLHPGSRAPPKRACMRAARQDGRGAAAAHIRRAARAGAARAQRPHAHRWDRVRSRITWCPSSRGSGRARLAGRGGCAVALEEAICAGAAGGDSGGGECRVGFRKSGEDARKEGAEGR